MNDMHRRSFLVSAVTLPAALRASALPSANNTVRVAVVGFRAQGQTHIKSYLNVPNVEIAALCDVDEAVLEKGCKMVEEAGKKRPATFFDMRKLLEDKSYRCRFHRHAQLPAHPADHLGLPGRQGRLCREAMLVQHVRNEADRRGGAQVRSHRAARHGAGASLHEAKQKMKEGVIGDVYMARGLCYKWRDTIGHAKEEPVPSGVHYNLWIGPAPVKPFTRNRFHYNWHWQWDYGNGDIGNQGIHQMHAARWALGVKYPTKISSMGGHYMFDDDQETPNTQVANFEFEEAGKKKLLVFEVRHWISNNEAGIGGISDPEAGPAAGARQTVGNIWYGSKGYLTTGRSGWQTFLGQEQAPGPKSEAGRGTSPFANFADVVRSRKREDLLAEIEEGAISTTLVHLANISYRVGRTLYFDPVTYSCKGDAEANAMFTRKQYRSPFTVPKLA